LAEVLHQASHRSREPFVRLNVSPLPEEALAVEIFGQAGPDAPERPGRFQQAAGGALYISEVADIPRGIQARLATFLDSGMILPVGALREIPVNVRLITATNRDPEELLRGGALSEELYHRLNVARLALPPLRERKEDIDFLLRHFLAVYAGRFKKDLRGFAAEARSLLAAYDYPGNVRELRNIVEYAAMVCPGQEIGLECLPAHLASPRKRGGRGPKRS
jgi:DNA-binding NtrC family response regulator